MLKTETVFTTSRGIKWSHDNSGSSLFSAGYTNEDTVRICKGRDKSIAVDKIAVRSERTGRVVTFKWYDFRPGFNGSVHRYVAKVGRRDLMIVVHVAQGMSYTEAWGPLD